MPAVVDPVQLERSRLFRKVYSCYEQNRDLISVGAYVPGTDTDIDFAIERRPHLKLYLQQGLAEQVRIPSAAEDLAKVLAPAAKTKTAQHQLGGAKATVRNANNPA